MSTIIKPELISVSHVSSYKIAATLGINDFHWNVYASRKDTKTTPESYGESFKNLENAKKFLALVDTTIDEHYHDEYIFNLMKEHHDKEQKEYEEKRNIAKALEEQKLKEMNELVKIIFAGFTATVNSLNSISVSDGTSSVTLWRDEHSASKRWSLDNTKIVRDSWGRKSYTIGEKKSTVSLEKLVEFTKKVLNEKTTEEKRKTSNIELIEQNDQEMIANGYELGGQKVYKYVNEIGQYISTSDGGKVYRKDNVLVNVKRVDGLLYVESYTIKPEQMLISNFKTKV